MGAVIWFLAALTVLWFALLHVLPLDEPLIFLIALFLAAVCAIKAVVDAIDAIGAIGEAFAERRGDFDD